MTIDKLPSGKYRIRQGYKGKRYSVTIDHKPGKKEADELIREKISESALIISNLTFRSAAVEYTESKRNVISPTTYKLYKRMPLMLSDSFNDLPVELVTQNDVQREINRIALDRSPKTVRNYHAFISAVLSVFNPSLKLRTTLPQKRVNEPYIPSDEDVRRLLECAEGTNYKIPLMLACFGMRRSEICALTLDDIHDGFVSINKAKVRSEDGWVIKTTKTVSSTRTIYIGPELELAIRENGAVYDGYPDQISDWMSKVERDLDMEHFSIHKLRHYFASKMSDIGIDDATIMLLGGWSSDHVMKNVYRHAMRDQVMEKQKAAAENLIDIVVTTS